MSSFDQTRDIERSLLHIITSTVMLTRLHIHRVKEEWFTSDERKFIFHTAFKTLEDTGSLITKTIFEYEVDSKLDDTKKSHYMTEWNLVEGINVVETPDVLIDRLTQANTGRQVLDVAVDVTNMLEEGRIQDAVTHLKQSAVTLGNFGEDSPMVELTDYVRRKKAIEDKKAHPEKYRGIKIGFKRFDDLTGGIFPGELFMPTGITGLGKSTFCKQIEKNIVTLNPGKNVLHIANEEHLEQVESKFDAVFSGTEYRRFKLGDLDDAEMDRWENMMKDMHEKGEAKQMGRVFVKEVPAFTDCTLIEYAYRQLEAIGVKIHAIIIDHLPHVKPIQQAWGENDEKAKAASDCKQLGRSLHVAMIVPTQGATVLEEKQNRGKGAGKLDVYGSKAQVHVANTFLVITQHSLDMNMAVDEEWERDVFWKCEIKKNRDGPPFYFLARHYVKTGRVEEIESIDAGMTAGEEARAAAAEAAKDDSDGDEKPESEKPESKKELEPEQSSDERPATTVPSSILERLRQKK